MSFESLLINTCDIVKETVDEWNQVTKTYINSQDCRIEYKNKWVRDAAGELIISGAMVFMKADADVETADRLRINGVEREIIMVEKLQDSLGIHHLEISIK